MLKKLSILIPLLLNAGWYIEQKEISTVGRDVSQTSSIVYFSEEFVKVTGSRGTFIVDLGRKKIHMMDDIKKIYTTVNLEAWMRMVNRVRGAMAEDTTAEIEVKRKGRGERIAGFETERFTVYLNGEIFQDIWVARGLKADEFMKLEKALESLTEGPKFIRERIEEELYKRTKWWPVKTVSFIGPEVYTSVITKIEKKKLKEEVFKPPEDYRKVKPHEFFQQFGK
jgi:hypothetical protein